MGNLLLVDDEPDILETLEEIFKYESGLDIDVYAAKSAVVALGMLERIKFDVVMTDIKMPGMSGIELYKRIKENWPKCRVIFLTGFRDFDNLYEISSFRDVRYLQKSEGDQALISAVAEAFEEIENIVRSEKEEDDYQAEIERAQMILRQSVMKEYFKGMRRKELTQEELDRIGLPLQIKEYLFIILVRIDRYQSEAAYDESLEREHLLSETIREFLPPRFSFYLYYDGNGCYLLFIQPSHFQEESFSARVWKSLYANITGALEYVQEKELLLYSLSLSFVTSSERYYLTDGAAQLSRLKQEAVARIGNGEQKIVVAESGPDTVGMIADVPVNYQLQVRQMEQALERKEFSEFSGKLRELTDRLASIGKEMQAQANELYYSISLFLLRYINLHHIRQKLEPEFRLESLIDVEQHTDMKAAAQYLQAVASRMMEEASADGYHRTDDVLEKAVLYIEGHISEDLTLTHIAEICYLNPSYLSRIFKQKHGCNITEYISRKRMEQAKRLLATSSVKVGEIAVRTGYLTAPSFTRVFRKYVGMSPVEYRDRYGVHNHEFNG